MPPLALWRPRACVPLLVMPPLGVEAGARLLRAPEPLDLSLRAPLDARTANSSPLIVVGAPGSGPSSSTPSYCDGLRRIDGAKPDWRPEEPLEPLEPLALDTGWPLNTVDDCALGVIGYVSRGAVGLGAKAVNPRSLPRNYVTRSNS